MLVGVATRRYARSLEPVRVTMRSRGTSKVSRRFVAKTAAHLAAWQTASLEALALIGLLIDGAPLASTAGSWRSGSRPTVRNTRSACGCRARHRPRGGAGATLPGPQDGTSSNTSATAIGTGPGDPPPALRSSVQNAGSRPKRSAPTSSFSACKVSASDGVHRCRPERP